MSQNDQIREFAVETDFQRKARRPGGVTRHQAVGRARVQIETLKSEFTDWLNDGFNRLQAAIAMVETYPGNETLIEDAFHASCQLRDVGTTMGYELITFVASRLCEVIEAVLGGADYDKDLISCHLDALQLARHDSYRNVSPGEVPELCDGLRRAAERSFGHPRRAGK
jgi:hypothetical protein